MKTLDHEELYSLWLNRKVALKRKADAVAIGVASLLPSAWLEKG